MFPEQKNKISWQPTANLAVLQQRARILQIIREFFLIRNVLEVETPLLGKTSVSDPHIASIPAFFQRAGIKQPETLYLQTSPEYAMKRLLAAGSGAIYQICKAFRQSDLGEIHQPEFTMLEWYRPGFNHHQLMEMDELLQCVLKTPPAERISYAALFEKYIKINPHIVTREELINCLQQHQINFADAEKSDSNTVLTILLTHVIEPQLAPERPLFLYDFPIAQAALAKIRKDEHPAVASRFEVYFKGMELANGFHELQSPSEQKARFLNDLAYRSQHHLPLLPLDEEFLAALEFGLPDCSGVALGIDRLIMLALNKKNLAEVTSFLTITEKRD